MFKTYYLTCINKKQADELIEINNTIKDSRKRYEEFKKLSNLWEINCNGILKIGETKTTRPTELSKYVGHFGGANTGNGRETHYRDYSKTLKEQQDKAWIINLCSDSISSVKSALKLMNEEWLILWEYENTDSNMEVLETKLKNQICYIKHI